jgi:hypothetical protein
MTRIVRAAVMWAMLAAGACGGSSGGGPAGVDGSKQVSAVTAAEKEMLCDWFAGMVGGYGAAPTCADGFLKAPPDKATCTTDFPMCAVTVNAFRDCVETILAAQAVCTTDALTAAQMNANCELVGTAGCFN